VITMPRGQYDRTKKNGEQIANIPQEGGNVAEVVIPTEETVAVDTQPIVTEPIANASTTIPDHVIPAVTVTPTIPEPTIDVPTIQQPSSVDAVHKAEPEAVKPEPTPTGALKPPILKKQPIMSMRREAPPPRKDAREPLPQPKVQGSLRDMNISDAQKMMLIRQEIEQIVNGSIRNIPNGYTPTAIPLDGGPASMINHHPNTGVVRMWMYIELDCSIVKGAFAYYKDNAPKPSHSEFLTILQEVSKKKGKLIRNIVPLSLN